MDNDQSCNLISHSDKQTYIVGVYGSGYPERRMINDRAEECSYVHVKNRYRIYAFFLKVIKKIFPSFERSNVFGDGVLFTIYVSKKDDYLIHVFDRIVLDNNHKWATTFEATLPAFFNYDPESVRRFMKKRLKHILSDNCKAIMPMSKWAYNLEIKLISEFASTDEAECVRRKMKVLYPPQKCFVSAEYVHQKCEVLRASQKIRFLYVGKDFVRKGGEIVLDVFDELSREYRNFSVVVIGNAEGTARKRIADITENSSWLQYYDSLSNDKVIELAKESNVGLLPTFFDTFGFSILEMQSCGCPVISTNGEARAEINDDVFGWIIDTKSIENGKEWLENFELLRSFISTKLKDIVRSILDDPSCIEHKALKSIERVAKYHDPERYSDELRKIYALCR